MKKLYLFHESCRASSYGIGSYIEQLICCMRNVHDLSVNLIVLNSDKNEFVKKKTGNYIVYYFPNIKQVKNLDLYYYSIWNIFLSNIDNEKNSESIFHLNYISEYPLVGFIKKSFPFSKIVFTIHHQQWALCLKGNEPLFSSLLNSRRNLNVNDMDNKYILDSFNKEFELYHSVDKLISLSHYTTSILKKYYNMDKHNIYTIHNALKDRFKEIKSDKNQLLRKEYGFKTSDKLLLFPGRVDETKGLSYLINSFKKIIHSIPNCYLVIAGDGTFEKYLRLSKPYWNKILFTGLLSKKELFNLYQIVDAGVLLSFHEQCSYSAIEMMMFRLPVITTDTTGLNEMFPDNSLKLSIDHIMTESIINTELCATAIKHALFNGQVIGQNNRNRFLSRYNIDIWEKEMKKVYEI